MITKSIPKPERNAHFIHNIPGTLQDLQERECIPSQCHSEAPQVKDAQVSTLKAPLSHLRLVFSLHLTGLELSPNSLPGIT